MVEIKVTEVVELFPFAARKAVSCELTVGQARAVAIPLEELLAAVKGNRSMASVHDGYLGTTPIWVFCTLKDKAIWNNTMWAEITVAEARALRDAENGS